MLDVRTWPKGMFLAWDLPTGRRSSKGVDCDILAQVLIEFDRILIPLRYTFFSGSPPAKNSRVKRVWHRVILGWVTDWKFFPDAHE
jgi:hypothetical protein